MNTLGIRVFLQYLLIFKLCRFPLALFFQRFRVQFMSRRGLRRRSSEVEGGARRQVGIGMNDDVKHIGIVTKISAEQSDEIQGGRSIVDGKRAANSHYAGQLSSFRRCLSRHCPLEGGNRLTTVALVGQYDGLLR